VVVVDSVVHFAVFVAAEEILFLRRHFGQHFAQVPPVVMIRSPFDFG